MNNPNQIDGESKEYKSLLHLQKGRQERGAGRKSKWTSRKGDSEKSK